MLKVNVCALNHATVAQQMFVNDLNHFLNHIGTIRDLWIIFSILGREASTKE
jgi:hypothetical protein